MSRCDAFLSTCDMGKSNGNPGQDNVSITHWEAYVLQSPEMNVIDKLCKQSLSSLQNGI
jgi:hypothetical protein